MTPYDPPELLDEMTETDQEAAALPSLTSDGFLPPGMHVATLDQLRYSFGGSLIREQLLENLEGFLDWVRPMQTFSCAYLGGGFVSDSATPADLDLILETRARYGTKALEAMLPFFERGLETIFKEHAIHLHFWCPGFPGGMNDFRCFFQYLRPHEASQRGLDLGTRKGLVQISLTNSPRLSSS